MKIIQITDTHIVPSGGTLHGLDPRARLDACIADVNANHADADLCVITGDLVHAGEIRAYRELRECLSRLAVPYTLLIGNHDSRENFLETFPETRCDENGFVQSVMDTPAGSFIFLDTVLENAEKGAHWGEFCARRAGWLRDQLAAIGDRPAFVFMHHPPFEIGLPSMDNLRLRKPHAFGDAVGACDSVRHLFFGHVHRPVSGSWRGIPFSALRGTNHQVAFDFETVSPVPKSHEPPAYAVIFLTPESVVVHLNDFLDETALSGSDRREKTA